MDKEQKAIARLKEAALMSETYYQKPLIVTTNLTLNELNNPRDTAHARIYDRLKEMCVPLNFSGESRRRMTAQEKLNWLKEQMKGEVM